MEELSATGMDKLEQMEEYNKRLLYEARKKNAVIASLLNIAIPGAGYVYCGNLILGLIAFGIGVILGIMSVFTGGLALIFVFMFWVVLLIDGVLAASRKNRKLRKEILK